LVMLYSTAEYQIASSLQVLFVTRRSWRALSGAGSMGVEAGAGVAVLSWPGSCIAGGWPRGGGGEGGVIGCVVLEAVVVFLLLPVEGLVAFLEAEGGRSCRAWRHTRHETSRTRGRQRPSILA
jgi:hypothetical protein